MTDEDEPDDGGRGEDIEDIDGWMDDVAAPAREHDEGTDPFERIGEGSGPRHGDPFDAFADDEDRTPPSADGADRTAPPGNVDDGPDPARDGLPSGIGDETGQPSAADPFPTFDEAGGDPFGEGTSVFEHVDVGEAGDDAVWERMESAESDASAVPGKRYVDVDKHSYCETCEYFSAPPAIECSHEGTDILEFVDLDTVRVVDCPIVAERNALEDD